MPTTSTRRAQAGEQFVAITKSTKENAQAYLRNNNYNLDAALNQFYSSNDPGAGALGKPNGKVDVDGALSVMFDSLRSDATSNELNFDGVERYCRALDVDMGNYEFFVLADIVQSQSFGQITREGFVKGWKQVSEETNGRVSPDMGAHQRYVRSQIGLVRTDLPLFKRVYRNAFAAGKEFGKKELGMAEALAYWGELLAPTMQRWKTANVDWLQAWTDYLTERFGVRKVDKEGNEELEYKRTVSKDLWNQTLLFAEKTLQDETLGFWSEEQAWPGLIDEFVVWCREKGIVRNKSGDAMEVEA